MQNRNKKLYKKLNRLQGHIDADQWTSEAQVVVNRILKSTNDTLITKAVKRLQKNGLRALKGGPSIAAEAKIHPKLLELGLSKDLTNYLHSALPKSAYKDSAAIMPSEAKMKLKMIGGGVKRKKTEAEKEKDMIERGEAKRKKRSLERVRKERELRLIEARKPLLAELGYTLPSIYQHPAEPLILSAFKVIYANLNSDRRRRGLGIETFDKIIQDNPFHSIKGFVSTIRKWVSNDYVPSVIKTHSTNVGPSFSSNKLNLALTPAMIGKMENSLGFNGLSYILTAIQKLPIDKNKPRGRKMKFGHPLLIYTWALTFFNIMNNMMYHGAGNKFRESFQNASQFYGFVSSSQMNRSFSKLRQGFSVAINPDGQKGIARLLAKTMEEEAKNEPDPLKNVDKRRALLNITKGAVSFSPEGRRLITQYQKDFIMTDPEAEFPNSILLPVYLKILNMVRFRKYVMKSEYNLQDKILITMLDGVETQLKKNEYDPIENAFAEKVILPFWVLWDWEKDWYTPQKDIKALAEQNRDALRLTLMEYKKELTENEQKLSEALLFNLREGSTDKLSNANNIRELTEMVKALTEGIHNLEETKITLSKNRKIPPVWKIGHTVVSIKTQNRRKKLWRIAAHLVRIASGKWRRLDLYQGWNKRTVPDIPRQARLNGRELAIAAYFAVYLDELGKRIYPAAADQPKMIVKLSVTDIPNPGVINVLLADPGKITEAYYALFLNPLVNMENHPMWRGGA